MIVYSPELAARFRQIRARYSEPHSSFASIGGYLRDLAAETAALRALFGGARRYWRSPLYRKLVREEVKAVPSAPPAFNEGEVADHRAKWRQETLGRLGVAS